jgi:hypothetical protein
MEERIWKGRKLIGKMASRLFIVSFDIIYSINQIKKGM